MTRPIAMETADYVGCIGTNVSKITPRTKPLKPDIVDIQTVKPKTPRKIWQILKTILKG